MTDPSTERALQDRADAWNAVNPVGTPIRYWPGLREGEGVESVTRSRASVIGGHTPVVWVEGRPDCIALTHVEPRATHVFWDGTPLRLVERGTGEGGAWDRYEVAPMTESTEHSYGACRGLQAGSEGDHGACICYGDALMRNGAEAERERWTRSAQEHAGTWLKFGTPEAKVISDAFLMWAATLQPVDADGTRPFSLEPINV